MFDCSHARVGLIFSNGSVAIMCITQNIIIDQSWNRSRFKWHLLYLHDTMNQGTIKGGTDLIRRGYSNPCMQKVIHPYTFVSSKKSACNGNIMFNMRNCTKWMTIFYCLPLYPYNALNITCLINSESNKITFLIWHLSKKEQQNVLLLSIMPLNCPWHFIPDHGLRTDTHESTDPKANQNLSAVGTEPNPFLEIMMCLHFRKWWGYGNVLENSMKLQASQINVAAEMDILSFWWKFCGCIRNDYENVISIKFSSLVVPELTISMVQCESHLTCTVCKLRGQRNDLLLPL